MTTFRSRLAAGEPLTGVLMRMPCDPLIELAALVGLDFVIIDCEHGPTDELALVHHLYAAGAMPVLVRISAVGDVGRTLDLGAAGIVVPHVDDVRGARDAVAATRYPPAGTRGFAGYSRAGRLGLLEPETHRAAADDCVVIAMIESPPAVAAAPDIAAETGIDGLLVGPADLAVASPDGMDIAAALTITGRTATGASVADVRIVGSRAAADAARADGGTVIVYNGQSLLNDLFRSL